MDSELTQEVPADGDGSWTLRPDSRGVPEGPHWHQRSSTKARLSQILPQQQQQGGDADTTVAAAAATAPRSASSVSFARMPEDEQGDMFARRDRSGGISTPASQPYAAPEMAQWPSLLDRYCLIDSGSSALFLGPAAVLHASAV